MALPEGQFQYNKAYEAYQQAAYINGRCPPLWTSIGMMYFHIEQYDDCLDALSRSTDFDPDNFDAWRNIGILVSNLVRPRHQ